MDARFMPAATVPHNSRTKVSKDKLTRIATLAVPGIRGSTTVGGAATPAPTKELECKPVKVVDGRDVIDVSGVNVDIYTLLGLGPDPAVSVSVDSGDTMMYWGHFVSAFIGVIAGLLIMDFLFGFCKNLNENDVIHAVPLVDDIVRKMSIKIFDKKAINCKK
jgi:hypothetical protein